MKLNNITVSAMVADWITEARGEIPLPNFIRQLLTHIALRPELQTSLSSFMSPVEGKKSGEETKSISSN
ncbi:hypothetical protein [Serratia marcescens]|uniref:hypothetical protein n=1 Tax=Serratia marcescens TaxID=615 RepID=UPI00398A1739